MLKKLKKMNGIQELSKKEQISLKGGMILCPPGLTLVCNWFGCRCVDLTVVIHKEKF